MAYAYSAEIWVAAHTAAFAVMTGGAADPSIKLRDGSDVLLGTIVLDAGASTCSGTTGDITFVVVTQEDAAPASGTASYAEICDGDGVVQATLDCVQGSSPVAGACVLNTLAVVEGAPVNVISATIPAGYTIPA